MKRSPSVFAAIVLVIATFAVAQSTRPAKESAEEVAKRMGTTVEQLERMMKRELGEPVVIDNDLVVGVHRDAAGHVTTVKVTTDTNTIELNREPSEARFGLRVIGGELTENPTFSSVTDFDGDGRIDQIMFRTPTTPKTGVILLRMGERFEPATAVGDGKRFTLTSTGLTHRFDFAQREWVDAPAK